MGCKTLFVQRAEVGASAEVSTLFVHSEGVPSSRTEDIRIGYVVHTDGDAQHGAERDEVGAHMPIDDSAVVGSPAVHHRIDVLEAVLRGVEARREPRSRPSRIGTFVEDVVYFGIEVNRPSLSELQDWAKTLDDVDAQHGHGHTTTTEEMRRIASASEIVTVGWHPAGSL